MPTVLCEMDIYTSVHLIQYCRILSNNGKSVHEVFIKIKKI